MKRFFITTLLCATALNANLTKEEVLAKGYKENCNPRDTDLRLAFFDSCEQTEPLTINKNHVPAQGFFPRGTEVYVPTADGSYEQAFYRGPDVQADKKTGIKKIYWSTVVYKNGKNPRSVKTRDLMIQGVTLRTIAFSRRASAYDLTELTQKRALNNL
jgi:hypothetical protein